LQEGLEKFQAVLAETTMEREAAEKINEERKYILEKYKNEKERLSLDSSEALEAVETAADRLKDAEKVLNDTEAYVASERNTILKEGQAECEELESQKEAMIEEIAMLKEKYELTTKVYENLRKSYLEEQSKLEEKRRELSLGADGAAKNDTRATKIMREKRDMWKAIESIQRDFAVSLGTARATDYLDEYGDWKKPFTSERHAQVIQPDLRLGSVANRHYGGSLDFEAEFGSELRRKITNTIYLKPMSINKNQRY